MLLKLYNENPNPREIEKIVTILRDGGTVIYPTDTLYAIGCDALNVRAVEKICDLKGIDPQKSNLSIICNDLSIISEYAKVSNPTFKLMKRNLPGPFTFILATTSSLPKIYKKKEPTISRKLSPFRYVRAASNSRSGFLPERCSAQATPATARPGLR